MPEFNTSTSISAMRCFLNVRKDVKLRSYGSNPVKSVMEVNLYAEEIFRGFRA